MKQTGIFSITTFNTQIISAPLWWRKSNAVAQVKKIKKLNP
jgi:hypothetical protein